MKHLVLLITFLSAAGIALAQPTPSDSTSNPVPGMPWRGAGVDSTALERVGASDSLIGNSLIESDVQSSAGDAIEAAAAEMAEPEPSHAELGARLYDEYTTSLQRERLALDYVTRGNLDVLPVSDYLRILPTRNRPALIDPPFGIRGTTIRPNPELGSIGLPTTGRRYTTDTTVDALIDWYADNYGFEFIIHRTTLPGYQGAVTMTVARAVRMIGGTMVSVMIWNPTVERTGSRRNRTVRELPTTTVSVTERAFRNRQDLIVEGPDAIVELTWKVPYHDLIEQMSARYQIDPFLIAALVQQESGFNPTATSIDSAVGLTQLIPQTAALVGVSDPNDPAQSLDGGVQYLKMMLRRYHGDVRLALAAYNAGPGNVDKYDGIPPFAETQQYVRRIMARYEEKATGGRGKRS